MPTDQAEIIPIDGARPVADGCFSQVDGYWQSLCNGRIMPARSEVDPRILAGVLDRVFLLERLAPGLARFRLAGAHLSDLMGMEVRGMPVSCFFLPEARDAFAEALESVFSEPAKVDMWLTGPRRLTGRTMAARLMLLPLRDAAGHVTRALGCLSASAVVGTPPLRFRIASDNRVALTGYGRLPAQRDAAPRPDAPPRGRPALRVIKGGGPDASE
jgi:hypothetical protein